MNKRITRQSAIVPLLLALFAVTGSAQVPRYDVTMTPADFNLLYTRDIFSDSALPSSFDFQSSHWNNTTIRFKGHSTRYYPKKSFNVKFPTSNLFQNIRTVSFNAMYTDKSLLREHLSWNLFEDMGSLSSRPHFGTLAINGTSEGLYLFIDKPDKYVLANRGRIIAPMYEASDTYISADLTVQPDSLLKLYYEKGIGNVNDYSDLNALIQALNSAPDASFADTVHRYFDVQSVLNWFAGNTFTMMGDSYNKNYFLYRDTSRPTQQWVVIPWDYDLSFGRTGDEGIAYPASLLNDGFAYSFPPLAGPANVLKDRFLNTPSLLEEFRLKVDTLMQTVFTEQRQVARIDSLAAVIHQEVGMDENRWGTHDDFLEHVDALKYYVTARRNYLYKTFINSPTGEYDDVTLPVAQLNVPYHFVGFDGRQIATLWFDSMSGLDSVRVEAFPGSVPPNVPHPPQLRYVQRWVRITPYPASATFTAKLQWSYYDLYKDDREVGKGVQDEHLLRPFVYDGAEWRAQSGNVNAYGNFVTIDSIHEGDCTPGSYFALMMSETYTQKWFRKPMDNWQRWYDVKFADTQNGFVVGDHGTIQRTSDGGISWVEGSIGVNLQLHGLEIVSLNNMYVVGDFGSSFRSVDSGKSWCRFDIGTTRRLNAVAFHGETYGAIVGDSGFISRTTDGGVNWNEVLGLPKYPENTCAIVDTNSIRLGGTTLQYIDFDSTGRWTTGPGIFFGRKIRRMVFDGAENIIVVGDSGFVLRFGPLSFPSLNRFDVNTSTTLRGLSVLDSSRFFVAGDDGRIFYTSDHGLNWYSQYSADSHDLFGMTFTDSTHGFAVGSGGTILTTSAPGTVTEIGSQPSHAPSYFRLNQNYPNPFNPSTTFSFELDHSGSVTLRVYDVLGREVATIVNEQLPSGSYERRWNAANVSSGVYFYRLEIQDTKGSSAPVSQVRKMLLLK